MVALAGGERSPSGTVAEEWRGPWPESEPLLILQAWVNDGASGSRQRGQG